MQVVGRLTSLAVLLMSLRSSRLDGRWFSLVLHGGWLLALGGFRTAAALLSLDPSLWPGSERGVRRRWRCLGFWMTGRSPSEDAVSAGPLSVADSSEGPLALGATGGSVTAASLTPFSKAAAAV